MQRSAEKELEDDELLAEEETVTLSVGPDGASLEASNLTMLEVALAIAVLIVAAFLIHRRFPAKHRR